MSKRDKKICSAVEMQTIDKCFHKEFGSGSRLKYSTSAPPLNFSVSWLLYRYCKDYDVDFKVHQRVEVW